MGITQSAKVAAYGALVALGFGPALARRRARLNGDTDAPTPQASVCRPPLAADARLLPCDLRQGFHRPDRVSRTYGSDTSRTVEYRFNSAGYRSEELDPDARFRVLLVGESHALGTGIPFDQTLGQRFKAHLAAALDWPEDRINLINLSVGGASADHCARSLIGQIDIVSPDLVLCVLPKPDRMEDYTADEARNYKVSDIDPDQLDDAPPEVLGFIDLYNPHLGRMNTLKNALLIQSLCKLRGIEHILLSEILRPGLFDTPILKPVFAQLDQDRVLLHQFFNIRGDIGADGQHAGLRPHAAIAIRILTRYGNLLSGAGATDRAGKLVAEVRRFTDRYGEPGAYARRGGTD